MTTTPQQNSSASDDLLALLDETEKKADELTENIIPHMNALGEEISKTLEVLEKQEAELAVLEKNTAEELDALIEEEIDMHTKYTPDENTA